MARPLLLTPGAFWAFVVLGLQFVAAASPVQGQTPAERVASLIDPAKLATLARRGANPRVQKYVAQLAEARDAGHAPAQVAADAIALAGMRGEAAKLTLDAMLRNLTIAERLGCLTPAGLHDMRRDQSPTITLGPYTGTSCPWITSSPSPSPLSWS